MIMLSSVCISHHQNKSNTDEITRDNLLKRCSHICILNTDKVLSKLKSSHYSPSLKLTTVVVVIVIAIFSCPGSGISPVGNTLLSKLHIVPYRRTQDTILVLTGVPMFEDL